MSRAPMTASPGARAPIASARKTPGGARAVAPARCVGSFFARPTRLANLIPAFAAGAAIALAALAAGDRPALAQGGIWTPFIPPGSTVRDVAPGDSGEVLIAGAFAGFRFDGLRMAALPISSPDENPLGPTRVLRTRSGEIWLGTLTHGLFRLQADGTVVRYTASSGLGNSTTDRIFALAEGLDGRIWAGTDGGGLSSFDGNSWSTLSTDQGMPSNVVGALTVDPVDGTIWAGAHRSAGSEGGLVKIAGGVITTYTGLAWIEQGIRAVLVDDERRVWVGFANGLARLEGSSFVEYPQGVTVTSLAQGAHGEIWFGANGRGVGHLEGDDSTILPGGPVSNSITALHRDPAGVLWVATQGGLSRFEGSAWFSFVPSANAPGDFNARSAARDLSDAARGDSIDARGLTWMGIFPLGVNQIPGSLGGENLVRVANGRQRYLGPTEGLPGGTISAVSPTGDGRVWAGSTGLTGGLALLSADGAVLRVFRAADGLPADRVTAVDASPAGVWAGTTFGAAFSDGNSVTALRVGAAALPDAPILGVDRDVQGRVWFATGATPLRLGTPGGGAVRFDPSDSSYVRFDTSSGFPTNDLVSVNVFANGDVWFGSAAGAIRLRDDAVRVFHVADGLPSENVRRIVEAADGRIWFATDAGLGLSDGANAVAYNTADGLAGSSVVDLFADPLGLAVACGGDGASLFHPDATPPRPEITNGPPLAVGAREVQFGVRGGDLDGGQRNLTLAYQIDAQTPSPFIEDRVAINATLPDGEHVLRLWAKDRALNVSPLAFEWPFTVDATPPRPIVSSPAFDDVVRGVVDVVGNVADPRFLHYLIELRPVGRVAWDTVLTSPTLPPPGEPLYRWDTTLGTDGPWELRVGSLDSLGLVGYVQVTVIVDNLAPSANVTSPARVDHVTGGRVFTTGGEVELYVPPNAWPSDQIVRIDSVAVSDSLRGEGWLKIWRVNALLTDLAKPATLKVQVPNAGPPPGGDPGLAPPTLQRVDPTDFSLVAVGGAPSADGRAVSTTIQSLGTFALTEPVTTGAGFEGVRGLDCQPRVLSPNGGGFDTETAISFELGRGGQAAVKVFDRAGRLVREVAENGAFPPGRNVVTWDGKNGDGEVVPSGLYVVAVRFDGETSTKTVVVANR
ncbi:MAG: two-component regulator propeller domain-containing protein [Candidatus Eiseniibacteriota bacterium]